MSDANLDRVPVRQLVLVPALITLTVTLLRLIGELMNWSPVFFNREPGGGGAVVGISWLPVIFGIYFAIRLARMGFEPASGARALGFAVLGLLLVPAATFAAVGAGLVANESVAQLVLMAVLSLPGAWVAMRGWPALGRVLLVYALAARIPVAVLMLIAMLGAWGTHYDAPPPGFPDMSLGSRYVLTGLVPQLTIWIWITVAVGAVVGAFAVLVAHRRPRPATV